jgi:hypothetical protein
MAHDIYEAIQAHAAAGSPAVAGNLHEEIWVELLRRSDPTVHNVRVTAGDGGIDGVGFQDPVTGLATVYQCKFFKDMAAKGHREDIVEAFVRACSHSFVCTTWVLLLPRQLSAKDLGWLMTDMRKDALALASRIDKAAKAKAAAKKAPQKKARKPIKAAKLPRVSLPVDVDARLSGCGIHYKEGQDLEDLLRRNLDVAGRFLPESAMALMDELCKERSAFDLERRNAWDLVDELRAESIRNHQVESRRAKAALSILNQGWANLTGTLQLALVDKRLSKAQVHEVAGLIEEHATSRAVHAYSCEGLVPGISELVAEINYQARVLKQVGVIKSLRMADADGEAVVAKRVLDRITELQRRIGDVVVRTFLGRR